MGRLYESLFCVTYADIAKLLGVQPDSVRRAASRGEFDSEDFSSVAHYILGKTSLEEAKQKGKSNA